MERIHRILTRAAGMVTSPLCKDALHSQASINMAGEYLDKVLASPKGSIATEAEVDSACATWMALQVLESAIRVLH